MLQAVLLHLLHAFSSVRTGVEAEAFTKVKKSPDFTLNPAGGNDTFVV
jgi:hypothetical protein